MHEFSLATQIVESVLEFVQAHPAGEVLKVRLQIGELTCVEAEQLRFCFNSIAERTPLENALLEIEPVSARIRCPHCRYQGAPRYWENALAGARIPTLECPECGQAARAIQGHDCEIKSIQFVDLAPAHAG